MLSEKGIETVYSHPILEFARSGNTPYHYIELWASALIKNVFSISSLEAYACVVVPFMSGVSCFAVFSFFSKYIKFPVAVQILLVFCLLHTNSVFHEFFGWVPKLSSHFEIFTRSAFLDGIGFKLLVPLPIVISVLGELKNEDRRPLILLTYFLLLATFSVGCCFWGALGLLLFYNLLTKNFKVSALVFYGVLSVAYGLFYILTGSELINNSNFWAVLTGDLQDLKTRLNIFAGALLTLSLILGFYFIIVRYTDRDKTFLLFSTDNLLFLGFASFIALCFWVIFFKSIDSVQLCSNAVAIIHTVVWVSFAVVLLRYYPFLSYAFIVCRTVIFIYSIEIKKTEFLKEKLTKYPFAAELSQIGLTVTDSNEIKSNPFAHISTVTKQQYLYLRPQTYYSCNPAMLYESYSKVEIDSIHQIQRQLQDLLFFYKSELRKNEQVSNDEVILNFVRKFKVNHMFYKPGIAIPSVLKPYISKGFIADNNDSLLILNVNR